MFGSGAGHQSVALCRPMPFTVLYRLGLWELESCAMHYAKVSSASQKSRGRRHNRFSVVKKSNKTKVLRRVLEQRELRDRGVRFLRGLQGELFGAELRGGCRVVRIGDIADIGLQVRLVGRGGRLVDSNGVQARADGCRDVAEVRDRVVDLLDG